MPRWLLALVAVAAFGLGWIANDLAAPDCVETTQERGIYRNAEVTQPCHP